VSASTVVLLPHAPSSVGQARHRLGADLRAHGVAEPAIRDATLVLSELMSNAVRHGRPLPGTQMQVAWTLSDGTLELAVSDGGGPTRPRTERPLRCSRSAGAAWASSIACPAAGESAATSWAARCGLC
jgi:anti-sigma regulatory factor (Ser/Thr protein kinase)